MPANMLRDWIDGRRRRVVWVDYDDYAARVFANSPPDWLAQATRYANTMSQARKAVHTDVLSIDCTGPCLAACGTEGEPADRALAALRNAAARAFVTEVIDALAHKHAADTDLVLRLQAPCDLLARCDVVGAPSFDELDDLGTALADLVRGWSDKPIAGLLLVRAAGAPLSADEKDAYEPLFAAAHHYGWLTAFDVEAPLAADIAGENITDLVLAQSLPLAALPGLNAERRRFGGGLDAPYWLAPATGALPADQLLYGRVPADAEPERVLERSALLRA